MADTIRDVVIKVAVENSTRTFAPLDMSAVYKQLEELKSKVKDAFGGAQFNTGGTSSSSSQSRTFDAAAEALRNSARAAAEEAKENKKRLDEQKKLERAQAAVASSLNASIAGTAQLAKGIGFLVAANHQQSESFVRAIASIQGYYDAIRGGFSTLQTFIQLNQHVSAVKAAQVAAGGAPSSTLSILGGATGLGLGSAAAIGVGAGVVGSGALYRYSNSLEQDYNTQIADQGGRSSNFFSSQVVRAARNARMALGNRDRSLLEYAAQPGIFSRRYEVEGQIRAQQAAEANRDLGRRQDIRSRAESLLAGEEAIGRSRRGLSFASDQQADYEARRAVVVSRQEESKKAHEKHIEDLEKKRVTSGGSRLADVYATTMDIGTFGLSYFTGTSDYPANLLAGGYTQRQADTINRGVTLDQEKAKDRRKEQEKQEAIELLSLDKEGVEVAKQYQDSAATTLQYLREQEQATRAVKEADEERVRTNREMIGLMMEGDRNRLKRIDDKAQRGEKLTNEEMRFAARFDTEAGDYARAQARGIGEASGIRVRESDLAQSTSTAAKAEAERKAEEPKLAEIIKTQSEGATTFAKNFEDAMKSIIKWDELDAVLRHVVEEFRVEFENFKMKWGSY